MRPAWRLATSSFSGRRLRAGLLVAAIALSAALVAGVSTVMASITASVEQRLTQTVGVADLKVIPTRSDTMVASVAERVRGWEEAEIVTAVLQAPISVRFSTQQLAPSGDAFVPRDVRYQTTAMATGVDRAEAFDELAIRIVAGRLPEATGEVVVDVLTAERLGWYYANRKKLERRADGRAERGFSVTRRTDEVVELSDEPLLLPESVTNEEEADAINLGVGVRLGDTLRTARLFGSGVELTVVGFAAQPPLGGRPQVYGLLDTIGSATGSAGELSEVLIQLGDGTDPEAVAADRNAELGEQLLVQTTAKIVSGVEQNLASSQLGFIMASVLAFLSAAFIILTGLSTDVTERQRELAMIRCVGGRSGQIAGGQLFIGLLLGVTGAAIGVPLGTAVSWLIVTVQAEQIPAGLILSPVFLGVAAGGAIGAGLLGAVYPAWRAAKLSPLEGLTVRSRSVSKRGVGVVAAVALGLIGLMLAIVGLPSNGQIVFWGYATVGMPSMMVGYFLLGVPLVAVLAPLVGPGLDRLLGLPKGLLARTVAATPYRHGLTAGAMMAGLALMISIWTNGGAMLRDWIDKISFPDAFVSGLSLTDETRDRLEALEFVENTCAITLLPVDVDAFGVTALQSYRTSFVAFEPGPFFEMTKLEWVQGSLEEALPKLEAGGSVIVAREFLIAKGLGVGETFRCSVEGTDGVMRDETFEIVGVVTSPGIEIVSKFFNIGEDYTEQAVHAVFGSRKDLVESFGIDVVHLFQIDLAEDIDDREAMDTIREALFEDAILDAGSGRRIKGEIQRFVGGSLYAFSLLAVLAMLVACFGVANVIVASVQTRKRELGVLRAVGAQRGTVARLIVGEAVIIALAAAVLGTLLGIQGSWAGSKIYAVLLGLSLEVRPPLGPIAAGWGVVLLMCVGAALPSVVRLARRPTRVLLQG